MRNDASVLKNSRSSHCQSSQSGKEVARLGREQNRGKYEVEDEIEEEGALDPFKGRFLGRDRDLSRDSRNLQFGHRGW